MPALSSLLNHEARKQAKERIQRFSQRVFMEHPAEINESYFQHLWFTTRAAGVLVGCGVVLFLHGLVPCCFTRTVSGRLDALYRAMGKRKPVGEEQWEI